VFVDQLQGEGNSEFASTEFDEGFSERQPTVWGLVHVENKLVHALGVPYVHVQATDTQQVLTLTHSLSVPYVIAVCKQISRQTSCSIYLHSLAAILQ